MKKYLFLALTLLAVSGCSNSSSGPQNRVAANSANQPGGNQSVVSHSTDPKMPPVNAPSNSTGAPPSSGGNSPMARAIDVSAMTTAIEKAESNYKAAPKDEKAKMALADAYFERGLALTEAAQYRAAIGDLRKGLKLNPDDKEAKDMYDLTINIFKSVGREPPKEGEEPAPMPFAKGTN